MPTESLLFILGVGGGAFQKKGNFFFKFYIETLKVVDMIWWLYFIRFNF